MYAVAVLGVVATLVGGRHRVARGRAKDREVVACRQVREQVVAGVSVAVVAGVGEVDAGVVTATRLTVSAGVPKFNANVVDTGDGAFVLDSVSVGVEPDVVAVDGGVRVVDADTDLERFSGQSRSAGHGVRRVRKGVPRDVTRSCSDRRAHAPRQRPFVVRSQHGGTEVKLQCSNRGDLVGKSRRPLGVVTSRRLVVQLCTTDVVHGRVVDGDVGVYLLSIRVNRGHARNERRLPFGTSAGGVQNTLVADEGKDVDEDKVFNRVRTNVVDP